jgi:hypothetical protein
VDLEVFRQMLDPVGEQRDLDFRRSGVAFVLLELVDDFLLFFHG